MVRTEKIKCHCSAKRQWHHLSGCLARPLSRCSHIYATDMAVIHHPSTQVHSPSLGRYVLPHCPSGLHFGTTWDAPPQSCNRLRIPLFAMPKPATAECLSGRPHAWSGRDTYDSTRQVLFPHLATRPQTPNSLEWLQPPRSSNALCQVNVHGRQ